MKLLLKSKILLLLLQTLFFIFCQYGCERRPYSGKLFCYPPYCKPHEDNWEYRGSVIVTQHEKGSFAKKTHKIITIEIKDRGGTNYLSDELRFYCANIDTHIKWDQFDKIVITLFEVGNKFEDDNYNKALIENGPNKLIQLNYLFKHSTNKFVRLDSGTPIRN